MQQSAHLIFKRFVLFQRYSSVAVNDACLDADSLQPLAKSDRRLRALKVNNQVRRKGKGSSVFVKSSSHYSFLLLLCSSLLLASLSFLSPLFFWLSFASLLFCTASASKQHTKLETQCSFDALSPSHESPATLAQQLKWHFQSCNYDGLDFSIMK